MGRRGLTVIVHDGIHQLSPTHISLKGTSTLTTSWLVVWRNFTKSQILLNRMKITFKNNKNWVKVIAYFSLLPVHRHFGFCDVNWLPLLLGSWASCVWNNSPRSMYQYSNMAPRLSGQTSIFGVVFFVFKSLLGIERQKKLEKFTILTREPRCHVRMLIYRTWATTIWRHVIQDGGAWNLKENIGDRQTLFCLTLIPYGWAFNRNFQ